MIFTDTSDYLRNSLLMAFAPPRLPGTTPGGAGEVRPMQIPGIEPIPGSSPNPQYPGIPNPPAAPGLPPTSPPTDPGAEILAGEIRRQIDDRDKPPGEVPDVSADIFGQKISLNPLRSGAIWALIVLVLIGGFFLVAYPAVSGAKGEIAKAVL